MRNEERLQSRSSAPSVRGGRASLSFLSLCAALVVTGCDAGSTPETATAGTIGLTLALPGVVVDTVRYELSGNGVSRTGDIAVLSDGATASVLLGGIPAGEGYQLTLSARTTDGKTNCAGSTTAAVVANATTALSVSLLCRTTNDSGAVLGTGRFSFCPNVTSLTASPTTAPPPMTPVVTTGSEESLEVAAVAVDLDAQPLTYRWAAPAGGFDDPAAARTVYRCQAPGPVTVTVTVSDGGCEETVMATLICLPFCASRADGQLCDDQDRCTQADSCQSGVCVGANAVVCAALDQCHAPGICNPTTGVCTNPNAAEGATCDDQNLCTDGDSCRSGRCVGGAPLVCAPQAQCRVPGMCNPADGRCSDLVAPDFTTCRLPGAMAACLGGTCAVSSCTAGVGDCNRVPGDGCETPLDTNQNCGTCGHVCGAGTTCASGLCLSPPPTGLAASGGGWKTTLTWAAAPGATGYQVLRGGAAAGPFQDVGTTTGTRLIDPAVTSGSTYFYVVRTTNVEGTGAASPPVAATTATRKICVTDQFAHAVNVYDTSAGGSAAPIRTIGGTATALRWPTDAAVSFTSDELFVARRGGTIDVFPMAATGATPPLRSFTTTVPGGLVFGLAMDDLAAELYTVDYSPGRPGGRVFALNASTGAPTRLIAGTNPQLGQPTSVIVDRARGEVLVGIGGGPDAASNFPRIQAFDIAAIGGGMGDIPPKRVLGALGAATVGGAAIAHDRGRDQLFTSCDCDNRITIFARTASGNAAPARTIELPPPYVTVHALLMDEAADTVWVAARNAGAGTGTGTYSLLELPRAGNGSVSPLRPPIAVGAAGRLAACD